ncbi:hypothetical protein FF011L_41940 [Roseimaritima multifibrata]|uniref:Uncharacterized protein n=1 Tax=Roseimaritima multifibrata TaxID=1930274 RepID=A0A517MKJ5_9BACT|nr:hypothetical protein FF011L_41940 [Roseimaritima multifibrata]
MLALRLEHQNGLRGVAPHAIDFLSGTARAVRQSHRKQNVFADPLRNPPADAKVDGLIWGSRTAGESLP